MHWKFPQKTQKIVYLSIPYLPKMRPDEHKQKKNAQYKKKHGIRDDKKSKAVPSKKTESGRVSVATTVSQTSQCKSSLPGSGQWLKKKEDRPHHSASITKDDIGSCGSGSETEMVRIVRGVSHAWVVGPALGGMILSDLWTSYSLWLSLASLALEVTLRLSQL